MISNIIDDVDENVAVFCPEVRIAMECFPLIADKIYPWANVILINVNVSYILIDLLYRTSQQNMINIPYRHYQTMKLANC